MRVRTRLLWALPLALLAASTGPAPTAFAGVFSWTEAADGRWDDPSSWGSTSYPRFLWDFASFGIDGEFTVDATDASRVTPVAVTTVRAGHVRLLAHPLFRSVLVIGDTGVPASLSILFGGVSASGAHTVGPDGTLTLFPAVQWSSSAGGSFGFVIEPGGVLAGTDAAIDGQTLRNRGTVSPGLGPGDPGRLIIGAQTPGSYDQHASGILEIDLDGAAPGIGHDQLVVAAASQPVRLDGALVVHLAPGYIPDSGDRYEVLIAPEITGVFADVTFPEHPGLTFTLVYAVNTVSIEVEGDTAIEVAVDIQPGSETNPVNAGKRGVTPAAILGGESLDVSAVDPASITLEGVSPLRHAIEDAAGPGSDGPDGFPDLVLKFDTPELVAALEPVSDGEIRDLALTGMLYDGRAIEGSESVLLMVPGKGKGPKSGGVSVGLEDAPRLWSASAPGDAQQTVRFTLSRGGTVTLEVYAVTGRRLERIDTALRSAGTHSLTWSPQGVASGVYFYRLEAPEAVFTRRFLLLR